MSPLVKKLLIAGGLFVVLLGTTLTVLSFGFDKTSVRTHAVSGPITAIVVKSDDGNIDLEPGGKGVDVRETQHYVFGKPALEQKVAGGVLTIDSSCESHLVRCYSDLRVSVPAGVGVTVETDSGDVSANGIDVRRAHAYSDSGDVELDLVGSPRLAWAHTDSGDVSVTVPRGDYAVEADTDSGETDVDGVVRNDRAPRSIDAYTDSGDVDVQAR